MTNSNALPVMARDQQQTHDNQQAHNRLQSLFYKNSIETTELKTFLTQLKPIIEDELEILLQDQRRKGQKESKDLETLFEAMSYATLGNGKRLRAFLFLATCYSLGYEFSCGNINKDLLKICCALECLHAYSLIHDDLPGMDNSPLRRGKPSTHKAFNHHTAILSGSALQNLGFEILLSLNFKAEDKVELTKILLQKTGSLGMMGGQQLDMDYEVSCQTVPTKNIETMLHMKTGAFFQACVLMAWRLFKNKHLSSSPIRESLEQFAYHFGLLFQLTDDLLDTTKKKIGKPTQQDSNKSTYTTLHGEAFTKTEIKKHTSQCLQHLENLAPSADTSTTLLKKLVHFVKTREA